MNLSPNQREVLLRMRAMSLNYRDIMIALAKYGGPAPDNVIPISDGVYTLYDLLLLFFCQSMCDFTRCLFNCGQQHPPFSPTHSLSGAGEVEEVGKGTTRGFKKGDHVTPNFVREF